MMVSLLFKREKERERGERGGEKRVYRETMPT
jgi:hypothetical protein